jgi:hypothetical protein
VTAEDGREGKHSNKASHEEEVGCKIWGMSKTFIVGHGAWNPGDGYTMVPAKSSISFYTQNSKWMCSDDIWALIKGTSTLSLVQECGAYKTSPNMRVFPGEPSWQAYAISVKPPDVELYFTAVTAGVTLKQIFESQPAGDFVWTCCRNLGLTKVQPKGLAGHTGVNLEERSGGFYDYNFNTHAYTKIWDK